MSGLLSPTLLQYVVSFYTQDPVLQVRLKLCELLPKFKQTFRQHTDRVQLHDLEFSLEKLRASFRDKELAYAAVQ